MKRHILCGAEVLDKGSPLPLTKSAKVGLITGPTAISHDGTPTFEILRRHFNLCAMFSPEHGVRGNLQAGAKVTEYVDETTGIPVYSTYGDGRIRSDEAIAALDCVFFDIQDIGSRYYTYQYTMTESMAVCAAHHVPFVVLDRPPMIPSIPQGNILCREHASFVGKYPTASRTGLTIGEFARYINESEGIGCDLTVIPCENVTSSMFYDEGDLPFVLPSPNLPSVDCALLYVGTCLIEGTNLSEGRGTTKPFEFVGAPWLKSRETIALTKEMLDRLNLSGVLLREAYFTPTFSKHEGQLCAGIQLHVTDRDALRPFDTALCLISAIRQIHPEFEFREGFMKHLFGSDEILAADFDVPAYLAAQKDPVETYARAIEPYRLYE